MTILIICAVLLALYLLMLMCRKGHKGLAELKKWNYAHRGLHGNGIPENSMAAFRLALEHGYGIELDVHLMKDGHLAIIHDSPLKRTVGVEGRIEDMTLADLPKLHLEGTSETVPTLDALLELYAGKAPLIVELKPVDDNYAQLCETACRLLETYEGPYCIESFDPRCIRWLAKNRPGIIRGQLSMNYMTEPNPRVNRVLQFAMTHLLSNFLTRPDFIAYRYQDRKRLSLWLSRKVWGVACVSWTLKTPEEFQIAVQDGCIPIFEGFEP